MAKSISEIDTTCCDHNKDTNLLMPMKKEDHTRKTLMFSALNMGHWDSIPYHIIRRYKNSDVVAKTRGDRNQQIVDGEMQNTDINIVEQHAEFTLTQINHELSLRLPNKPHVCDNTMSNIFHGRFIAIKLMRNLRAQRNIPQVKTAR